MTGPAQAQPADGTVTVGGVMWWDDNSNGIRDEGEHLLRNAGLEFTGPSGNPFPVSSFREDEHGRWYLDTLPLANFQVCVVDPGPDVPQDVGVVPTLKNQGVDRARDSDLDEKACLSGTTPTSGEDLTFDGGFRMVQPVSVGGQAWLDAKPNGLYENWSINPGEPVDQALSGVTVTVKDANGALVGTTTTDAEGRYLLIDPGIGEVPPGEPAIRPNTQYQICFDPSSVTRLPDPLVPAQLTPLSPEIADDGCITITTPAEGPAPAVDAGFRPPLIMSVGSEPYVDVNKNGLEDAGDTLNFTYTLTNHGTVPLSQIAVTSDRAPSVVCPKTELAPGESMTCAGEYVMRETDSLPEVTWHFGEATGVDSSGRAVEAAAGHQAVWVPQPPVILGDKVWLDLDHDGVQDGNESPLVSATVTLKNVDGAVLETVATNGDGNYAFFKLGRYTPYAVCFDPSTATGLPEGVTVDKLRPTIANVGDDAMDSDIDLDGCVAGTTTDSDHILTVDAGYATQGSPTPGPTGSPTPGPSGSPTPSPTGSPTPGPGEPSESPGPSGPSGPGGPGANGPGGGQGGAPVHGAGMKPGMPGSKGLPDTGSDVVSVVVRGGFLIFGGAVMLLVVRRWRLAREHQSGA